MTLEEPKGAESHLMADTSGITSYFERLAGREVQLKPSTVKNELNAAIHIIKFVKWTKITAVTEPAFFATLLSVSTDYDNYVGSGARSMPRLQQHLSTPS